MIIPTSLTPRCRLIVVKATERCNLNCSYCYMFNGGDKSYLRRPPIMTEEVSDAMFERVRAHCAEHSIDSFTFVLHGGEPMVAPPKYYRRFIERAHALIGENVELRFAMQTNGTLLTPEWCQLFAEKNIGLSFSIDGPERQNDRYRLDRKGRGSFARVMHGWTMAQESGLRPGVLLVIDPQSDPIEMYEFLKSLNPSTVDFLLPDATHDKPPPFFDGVSTLYANWLLRVFNAWEEEGGAGLKIRIFLQLMRSLIGFEEGYDVLGQGNIEVLVVETDGEIQPLDGLRICADGFANTSFNVRSHELDAAFTLPIIRQYQYAHSEVPPACVACDALKVCGGGFLAHRYSADSGFSNPSIYCKDMKRLIREVGGWLVNKLPETSQSRLVLDPTQIEVCT